MALNRAGIQTSLPLSNLSLKLANAPGVFQARAIFPPKRVAKGTGKIRVYSRDNSRIESAPAGRRAAAVEIERGYSLMSFATQEEALRELILDKDVRDADADIADMKLDSVQDLTEKQLLLLERRAIAKAFTSTNLAAGHSETLAGGLEWTNAASTPIKTVNTAKEIVRQALMGRVPNCLCMDPITWNALSTHAEIVDRVKYVAPGIAIVRQDTVAQVLGVDHILILGALENSAPPDEAGTITMAPMLADKALLCYIDPAADGLRTGGTFGKLLVPDGGDFRVKSYRDTNGIEGEWVEVRYEYAFQFMAVDSAASGLGTGGYLISNTVA